VISLSCCRRMPYGTICLAATAANGSKTDFSLKIHGSDSTVYDFPCLNPHFIKSSLMSLALLFGYNCGCTDLQYEQLSTCHARLLLIAADLAVHACSLGQTLARSLESISTVRLSTPRSRTLRATVVNRHNQTVHGTSSDNHEIEGKWLLHRACRHSVGIVTSSKLLRKINPSSSIKALHPQPQPPPWPSRRPPKLSGIDPASSSGTS
jgi:hypothetical protein